MKLIFTLLTITASANQLAQPNPAFNLPNAKNSLKTKNCAIFDSPATNLVELNEQRVNAESCEKENHVVDMAQVKKFYTASSKSLVDRTLATALALHGPKAEFKSFKNKVDLAKSLVKSSDMYDWSRFENDAGVNAVAIAVDTIVQVARLTQEKLLSSDEILYLANSFLLSDPQTTQDTSYIALALSALNDDASGLAKPVKFVKSGSYPTLNFQLRDVFDNQVETARFSVKINEQVLDLKADGNADLTSFNLDAGLHEYDLSVSGSDMYAGFDSKTFKIFVPSAAKVSVENAEVKVMKKGSTTGKTGVSGTLGDKIVVSFEVVGCAAPHQAMVKFSKGGLEAFALAKLSHGHDGLYLSTIEITKSEKSMFSSVSGKWEVTILVADITMPAPISQSAGKIKLILSGEDESEENNQEFKPKRTIFHTFPEAEARPAVTLSFLFTALTLAPLGVLIVLWGIIGFNFKAFNLNLWSVMFHAAIGAVMALYVSYWVGKFNMFFTVRYLAIIGIVLMISGNKHLNALAKDRKIITAEKPKSD
jgi:hypothetical protein